MARIFQRIDEHVTLATYRPPTLKIECVRCRRDSPSIDVQKLRRRFGDAMPLAEMARRIAAEGAKPCGLAIDGGSACSAGAYEPPVEHWATLYQALHGGWTAELVCHRHLEALKRASPCPDPLSLDVPTLAAALGHHFKLMQLPSRCECPRCHTSSIEIRWRVPEGGPEPSAPVSEAAVLQLRPTRAQAGRRTLKVIGGKGG